MNSEHNDERAQPLASSPESSPRHAERSGRATVILKPQATYHSDEIEAHVLDGLSTLELTPWGRTLIKPNVVASGSNFPHAFTRPEFTAGVAFDDPVESLVAQ